MRDDAGRPLFKQLRELDEAPLLKTLFRERAASAHADHPGKLIQGDRLAKSKALQDRTRRIHERLQPVRRAAVGQ